MIRFRHPHERPLNCMQVGRRLQSHLDGEVDDLTARRIKLHLEDCRRCGLEVATYTEIKACLTRRGESIPDSALVRLRSFGQRLIEAGPRQEGDTAG